MDQLQPGDPGKTDKSVPEDGDAVAFLSYAHVDDAHVGNEGDGPITEFRRRLEIELWQRTGRRDLRVFQDRDGIAWGQAWKERVDSSLDAATFFIPIVTPAFLGSEQCRRELARFLDREKQLGRADLVLPVYWIEVRALEPAGGAVCDDDTAVALAARQYADWRELRFEPLDSPECRKALAKLASRVRDVLDGVPPAGPAQAAADDDAPAGPVVPRRLPALVVDPHRGDFTTVAAAVAAARPGDPTSAESIPQNSNVGALAERIIVLAQDIQIRIGNQIRIGKSFWVTPYLPRVGIETYLKHLKRHNLDHGEKILVAYGGNPKSGEPYRDRYGCYGYVIVTTIGIRWLNSDKTCGIFRYDDQTWRVKIFRKRIPQPDAKGLWWPVLRGLHFEWADNSSVVVGEWRRGEAANAEWFSFIHHIRELTLNSTAAAGDLNILE